jgi:alanine-glyoxylate transaminase / serine-glyoxylate transaminase / serine-pyruvate transaminase
MSVPALPSSERILLGPGPSLVSPRVMRALSAPVLGHLDPQLLEIMDDLRAHLLRLFKAPDGSLALAVSGTGTSGMETAVANLVAPETRVLVVVTGYFGERLVEMCRRYGATVARVDVEWGRAADPAQVERALKAAPADVVAVVHAETSTGVRNPVAEIATIARRHGALTIVDAVTSLGGHPVDVAGWGVDVCYSGTQKCIGAPSGLAPIVFTPLALERVVECRSFYFDVRLLEQYWTERKYHHTISASLVYALREALVAIDEEGLEARWRRHEANHRVLAAGLAGLGLSLLPPAPERLWTLNAIRTPDGLDEALVRRDLREEFNIEIGAGMGPLAGRLWRVGLMGASSSAPLVLLLLSALERVVARHGHRVPSGAGTAAAIAALG